MREPSWEALVGYGPSGWDVTDGADCTTGGQFSAETFPGGRTEPSVQCFGGDRAIRVDNFGRYRGGFLGLRRRFERKRFGNGQFVTVRSEGDHEGVRSAQFL